MRAVSTAVVLVLLCSGSLAQAPSFPEGAATPRELTAVEAAWLLEHPLAVAEVLTPPPTGPVRCVAEYAPMEALLMAWEGSGAWKSILAAMAAQVTTVGNAGIDMVVDSTSEIGSAQSSLAAAGTDMGRVTFVVRATNTIWIRDYGPRYVYQGGCRAIVDHTYNRPRPQDNAFNAYYAGLRGHAWYDLGLIHGGGNYHLDAVGRSRTSRLVVNENPTLTEVQIHAIWQSYQNVGTRFYDPLPTFVDATQHIDMWMQVTADDVVVISDWPANPGSTQDQICDAAAVSMAAEGYTVHRVPARNVGGVHYTYTNVVMCNDLVLVPTYTNSQVASYNSTALTAWQAAVPGKTVVPINCQGIVSAAGVMHCIVMHVPAHQGGTVPTAYLVGPNGGEVLLPGSASMIRWISDDDVAVTSVDLLLSTDGGSSFPLVIAAGLPDTGSFSWTVPAVCSGQARIRVVARDAQGQTGHDDSEGNFLINGSSCVAMSLAYGTGKPGRLGLPVLAASPPVFDAPWSLELKNAWPGAAGFLLIGPAAASFPFDGGTVLVAFTDYPPFFVAPQGSYVLAMHVPYLPEFAGVSVFWQVWIFGDPGASGLGWTCSNAVETRIGF